MAGLNLGDRLAALAEAVRAGRAVLPEELTARARAVEERAGHRLRLSDEHTVVALAGATGSGKSSVLNALVGAPVATVDVLRPTTSEALAVLRGGVGAAPLLDWLGVRARVTLDPPPDASDGGLVLLDLPDHDSVRTDHRLEAERLVGLVDLLVWVLDPQKYADAAVHDRYLRPLARHAEVMIVVLNQVDRLPPADRDAALRDLRRLLADDGLAGVPVLALSAVEGTGVADLLAALEEAARRRVAARARVEADVIDVAADIAERCGSPAGPAPGGRRARAGGPDPALVAALSAAAGVPTVVTAVRGSTLLAARRATGWPPTRWVSRLRADPLRTLHLAPAIGRPGGRGPDDDLVTRTSLPPAGAAQGAAARSAVRAGVDAATTGLPDPWVLAARSAVEERTAGALLTDALDRAVAGSEVTVRRPRWWSVVGVIQWVLLAVMLGGLVWLGALAALDLLQLPVPEAPRQGEVPVPTLAAVGGGVVGLIVAGLARLVATVDARRGARRAAAALEARIVAVCEGLVSEPLGEVLGARERCRVAALIAATPVRPGRRR